MGLGGPGGIFMDGFTLHHSKCSSGSLRYLEDEFQNSRELHSHRMENELSMSSSGRSLSESMKQEEILHLEQQLETQIELRRAMESCLGYESSPSSEDTINSTLLPEDTAELIREIAALEVEVSQLAKYFLHLYQKTFSKQVPSSFPSTKVSLPEQDNIDDESRDSISTDCKISKSAPLAYILKSTAEENNVKAVRAYQSMQLSLSKNNPEVSLAKRLGTRFSDLLPETPTRLSEEMVKYMATIYCKLADPPLKHFCKSSRNYTSSSLSQFSSTGHNNTWSSALSFKDEDEKLDNPFSVKGLLESNGPYSKLVEVPSIYRDDRKLGEVKYLLQDFKSIISRLKEVDPKKLTHQEKLAFWINVHNSLVMNAFLAYGIPGNSVKRPTCLHKAAYNIGGHSINAYTIQSSILRCRMPHAEQRLRSLIPSRSMPKTVENYEAYAIDKPEPLLYFALSFGGYTDPAVHAFTPTYIFHELETAKNEYIRATLGIGKKRKVFLPTLVNSFSKESGILQDKVLLTILQSLPESFCKRVKKCLASDKSSAQIEWIPYDSSFRYLISKELVKHTLSPHSKTSAAL